MKTLFTNLILPLFLIILMFVVLNSVAEAQTCSEDFLPCYKNQGYRMWIQDSFRVVKSYCCTYK